MSSQPSHPSTWTVKEVKIWACSVKLSAATIDILVENEVDGATLTTLTKADLRDELGIRSLPTRRYLWEMIQAIRDEQNSSDLAVAVKLHSDEIEMLEEQNGDESVSGENYMDSVVVHTLRSDANIRLQILEDHIYCLSLQKEQNRGEQLYEDMDTARQEQLRVDAQFIQTEYDKAYATTIYSDQVPVQQDGNLKSLFSLCIDACVKNRINVSEALTSGTIQPLIPVQVAMTTNTAQSNESNAQEERFDINKLARVHCNVCFTPEQPGFTFACGHPYCIDCTRAFVSAALRDSTLLPLRCCDIPIDTSVPAIVLDKAKAARLHDRTEEIQSVNKMYCPSCNKFFNLDRHALYGNFACECGAELCAECRTAWHPKFTCEQNKTLAGKDIESLLRLARELGWKQCPQCEIMIEFITGCNHMKCTNCQYDFCFQCLSVWDSSNARCSSGRCELWEEDRLMEAGEQRVRAMEANRGRVLPAAQRRQQVAYEMDALRENEACHHRWVRQSLRGTCENCSYDLWVYGMVCRGQCRSTVCHTCAHHRIPTRGWR